MKFDIVEWMAKYGHVSYRNRIEDLKETISLTKAEAGRYWQECEDTQAYIKRLNQEIAEVEREAEDRYMDWVTD